MRSRNSIRVVLAARRPLLGALTDALAAPGVEIVAGCTSREEALTAIGRSRPDVCIVDRDLAGGSLIATAAIALVHSPKVVVIGGRDGGVERAFGLAGASAYLPGDLDAAGLLAAVLRLAGKDPSC